MGGRGFAPSRGVGSPATTDRIVVGACAAIWLVLLGVSVAALVALIDLGRGFHKAAGNPHTGLLYIIIGVSVLVILAAIPLLLRARRTAGYVNPVGIAARGAAEPLRKPVRTGPHGTAGDVAAELRGADRRHRLALEQAVDRIWLRGTAALVGTLGAALVAVAAATYLMAVGKDVAAWTGYGLAGAVAVGLPVMLWVYLRQLGNVLAAYRR